VRVFVGYDSREKVAFDVAVRSLRRHSPAVDVTPLHLDRLASSGLLRRPMDRRPANGAPQLYDFPSNAPCSTEFAISRFLVPMLAQTGFALFVDCDVVFLADVAELFALADPTKAIQVVRHTQGGGGLKMDGQTQTSYPRKNESSVMLWNCDHAANRRLSLQDVNERRGFDLHSFYWLADEEIGYLPAGWNWLVNVEPKPDELKLAHYTLGTPDMIGDDEHSHYFREAQR
jgi:hypothetical protein